MRIINLHFRACDYIKYGWDIFLVDPNGRANVQQKLQAKAAHADTVLLQSIPKPNDKHWSKQIYKIPKIMFSTIYDFLIECKVYSQPYLQHCRKKRQFITLLSKC